MDPQSILDSQFVVIQPPVYRNEGFTVAYGFWKGSQIRLGMRWDGEADAAGYPVGRGGRPKWFVLPGDLAAPVLSGLLGAPYITPENEAAIKNALATLKGSALGAPGVQTLREQVSASQAVREGEDLLRRVASRALRVEPRGEAMAEKEGSLHIVHLGGDKYMATWADYAQPGARAARPRMCVGLDTVDAFLRGIGVDESNRKRVGVELRANSKTTVGIVRLTENELKKLGLV